MKTLTKAEEQVMKVLWKLGGGLLMELVAAMPDPQPHKNTVATLLKILSEKEFVRIESAGRINTYFPAVTKKAYSKNSLTHLTKKYFDGSFNKVVSFLVEEKKLSVNDLELLLKQLKKK